MKHTSTLPSILCGGQSSKRLSLGMDKANADWAVPLAQNVFIFLAWKWHELVHSQAHFSRLYTSLCNWKIRGN